MDVDTNIQRRNLSFKLFVENSYCCSVTKLCLTLQFHGLQHTRIFSPPLSPGVCSDSCSLSRWCCLTISSSAVSFFFCLQSFPASGFPFQWVDSLHQVAKVLEFQLQHKSFQWIFRDDFLQYRLVWSPCSPRDFQRVFSSTTVQKYQFFSAQPSSWSNSHIHTWLLEKL